MKRLLTALLCLTATACSTHRPPPSAKTWTLTLIVTADGQPVGGAYARVLDNENAGRSGQTDATGHLALTALKQSGFTVCVVKDGLKDACTGVTLTANQTVTIAMQSARATQVRGRVWPSAGGWRYPDNTLWTWNGITAFGLLEQVAHGREAEARSWMKTQRAHGVTVVRVLATNYGWLELPPADGLRAMPRFFEIAKEEDVYVLMVALAGTGRWSWAQVEAQVRAVGSACAAAENCILELANEPYHSSQHGDLYSLKRLKALRALVPSRVPVSFGAPRKDEPLANTTTLPDGRKDDGTYLCNGADFVTLHRGRRDDIWDDQRRFTELSKVARACEKRVVDDEPYGFAETPRVGTNQRRTEDYAGFGQGVLSQLFNLDSTFHCDACLKATPLGEKQTAALKQFVAGRTFISTQTPLRFANAKAGDSAVKDASLIGPSDANAAVRRIFSFFGQRNLIAYVGLRAGRDPQVQWQNGWRQGALLAERPGFALYELAR